MEKRKMQIKCEHCSCLFNVSRKSIKKSTYTEEEKIDIECISQKTIINKIGVGCTSTYKKTFEIREYEYEYIKCQLCDKEHIIKDKTKYKVLSTFSRISK